MKAVTEQPGSWGCSSEIECLSTRSVLDSASSITQREGERREANRGEEKGGEERRREGRDYKQLKSLVGKWLVLFK